MADMEPYLRGRRDHALGIPRCQNPYEDDPDTYGTTAWESWFEGWDDAESWRALRSEVPFE